MKSNPESRRLHEDPASWKQWGPYLAERAWGTVREDYSSDGTPGNIFRTTMHVRASIAGMRMVWRGSAMINSIYVLPGALEWARFHFEGTPFWALRPGRESWGGRKGILFLS